MLRGLLLTSLGSDEIEFSVGGEVHELCGGKRMRELTVALVELVVQVSLRMSMSVSAEAIE